MAEVYLAEQSSLRRQVAVKVLKRELAKDETYVKRFQREAQAAASLVHANIVQIYEVGCVDGIHYIAQEYVQGQNLREWMARHGPPDLPHGRDDHAAGGRGACTRPRSRASSIATSSPRTSCWPAPAR